MTHYEKETETITTAVRVDGKRIPLRAKNIYNANHLRVEAGTNGICGGDSGHGSRTYLSIIDAGGTDLRVNPLSTGVEIVLGGDSELWTFIEALRFAADALQEMRNQSKKGCLE